jgi:hypothetical protein
VDAPENFTKKSINISRIDCTGQRLNI